MTVAELKASIRWALIRAGLAFVAIVGLIVFLVRRRRTAQVTIDDFRT
jgi:cytochrome oxidase assembly protein ShyY1